MPARRKGLGKHRKPPVPPPVPPAKPRRIVRETRVFWVVGECALLRYSIQELRGPHKGPLFLLSFSAGPISIHVSYERMRNV